MEKDVIREIYAELNQVNPVDFDCGKLCDEICCVYDDEDYHNEDLAIFLLPGEELIIEEDENFELIHVDAKELKYPFSWKNGVYLLKCKHPPKCNRNYRPIQCRTFPLIPHITKDNEFHLVFDESEYPYECPLIHEKIKLNRDFVKKTYECWKILIKDPLIYDLISMDSRKKENKKTSYEIII